MIDDQQPYNTLLGTLQQQRSTHAPPPAKKRKSKPQQSKELTKTTNTIPPKSFYESHFAYTPSNDDSNPITTIKQPWFASCTMLANTATLPDTTATSLSAYSIPPRLQARWTDTTGHDALHPDHQAAAFALFNRYLDVHMVIDNPHNTQHIQDALLLHIVNHCARAADVIKRNNDAPEPRPRDQGFSRTKALLLLPMRNAAAATVLRLCSLAQRETRADSIQNKQRFLDEYGGDDDEEEEGHNPTTRALRSKPADHRALFHGNTDDHLRLGIKITRGAVRLYTDFYDSDIIVASPIALVTMFEEQGPASFDWASSIEIIAMPSADVLLMQNWQHVRTVMDHVNRKPTALHDSVDIMRVRDVYLTEQGATVRQLVLMAPFATAETNSLFHAHAHSHAGGVRIVPKYDDRVLRAVVPQLRQLFRRIQDASDPANSPRFVTFTTQIYPRIKESGLYGQLIIVPSYLDFIRIRRFFDAQDAPWDAITEYTPPKEAAQLRAYFSSKRRRILVYTERAHFYHRYTLHGVHDIVFYQLPVHAEYYAELLNMMALRSAGEEHGTVTVLFDTRDALVLERVVGTRRARRMCSNKVVAFLAVPSNSLGSNVLDFRITCASPDPTQCSNGKCTCNYARDQGCRCRELADNGLLIRLRKTPAILHYPLTYITSYNARPYEEYIMTGCWAENRRNGPRDCRDDDQQPTCGIYTYHNPITDTWLNQSTGFCCQCTMTDYHNNAKIVRADGLDCQTPVKLWNNLHATCRADQGRNRVPPGTAHCMRFDENEWYEGFRVGTYQQRFTVTASLMTSQQRVGRVDAEVTVGPDRRVAVGGGTRSVLLTLVGDFAGYQELQSLAGRVLFIPSKDIEDISIAQEATFRPKLQGEWMLLPDTLVGTGECGKIGTTLAAFRNQAPRGGAQRLHPACLRDRDCLAYQYQLGRFVDDDRGRQARGQVPLYMLSGVQGPVMSGSERMTRTVGGMFALQLPVLEPGNSGVVIEVAADSLRFVTVTSPARVVDAVGLCDFNGRNCGAPFEALRETRYLTLTVQNTGTQPSDYYVGLVNCTSEHVVPPSQRLVSIAPSASTQITFDIRITSDQVAQYGCIATITDTRAAVLDRRLVTFSVTATAYDPKPLDLVGAVPGSGGPNSSTSNPFYDPFLATADGGGGDGFTARPIDASNDKVQEVLRRRVDGSSAARGGVGGNGTVGNGTGGSNTTTVNACAAECKGLGDVGCNMVHRCTGPLVLYGMLVVALGILVVGLLVLLLVMLVLRHRRQRLRQEQPQGTTKTHYMPAAVQQRGSVSSLASSRHHTPPRRRSSRVRVRSSSG